LRKLLNTLYITSELTYVSLDNENIVVKKESEVLARVPFVNIENIVCFNYLGCSPALMGKCASKNIPLNFVTPSGKYLASVTGTIKGNVVLRQKQFDSTRLDSVCLELSKNTIVAKFHNCRVMLAKFIKNHNDNNYDSIKQTADLISNNIEKVNLCNNVDEIRGIEGETARMYFRTFGQMIRKDGFIFNGRSKRPPLDNVNALLSFCYTLLTLEIKSALETVGLDPYVGFMHTDRAGRPALALDLVEELRAFAVDNFVINIVNLGQVNTKDFYEKEGGAVLFTDEGRRKILKLWEDRKKDTIKHKIINEKLQIGLVPYVQAQLFAKYLRGDMEQYCPFIWS